MIALLASLPACAENKKPTDPQGSTQPPAPSTVTTIVNDQSTTAESDSANQKTPHWYAVVNEYVPIDAILVLVTGLTGLAIWRQSVHTAKAADAATSTLASNKEIERAYIGFGVWLHDMDSIPNNQRALKMSLQILNFGNTPGTIEEIVLAYHLGQLAKTPSYQNIIESRNTSVFLLSRGQFALLNQPFTIANTEWVISTNKEHLCLLGYVIYRDRFRRRFKAGYARRFVSGAEMTSDMDTGADLTKVPERLPFVSERDYNYDREIDENGKFTEPEKSPKRYLARFGWKA